MKKWAEAKREEEGERKEMTSAYHICICYAFGL
jgi:hypothetical protein